MAGILPILLAVLLFLLPVGGQECSAVTKAVHGDDLATLRAKVFANFRANCPLHKKCPAEKTNCK